LGLRSANLARTVKALRDAGVTILRRSSVYESEPWGEAEGENFLNAILEIERHGSAHDLLRTLHDIENQLGRTRERPYAPRACDLDLLLWGDEIIQTAELIVPHPKMTQRKFVLVPLCELIPDVLHPVIGRTMADLLAECPDPLSVWRFTSSSSSHS
jgi:2-amino-4-hydroxy-6-hydroxymethyldihydropteridine diphosphokinase